MVESAYRGRRRTRWAAQTARWTLPAFRQLVQTCSRFGVPFTTARTRCTFGFHRRLDRRWEWETCMPKNGFFPQMSQTAAMARRGYQTVLGARGRLVALPTEAADSCGTATAGREPWTGKKGCSRTSSSTRRTPARACVRSRVRYAAWTRDDLRVRFATDVAGAYEGFAVVQALDLARLQDFLQDAELWADDKESAVEGGKGAKPAKRDRCDILGIVRIKTAPGAAESVFETLNARVTKDLDKGRDPEFHGVSMVFGSFDILLTLNGSVMEEVMDLALSLQGSPASLARRRHSQTVGCSQRSERSPHTVS